MALAGLAGLGASEADARVAMDGGPPTAKKQPDPEPSRSAPPSRTDASDGYAGMHDPPPARPAPPPRRPSSPPTSTDASDGYAGMHDDPAPRAKPTPRPDPAPARPVSPAPQSQSAPVPREPAAPPTRTDASDGYAGLRAKPEADREPARSRPDRSEPARPEPAAQRPAPPTPEPPPAPAAPPTHTDASDGYAGMGGQPPAPAPVPPAPAATAAPAPAPAPAPEPTSAAPPRRTDASDGYAGLRDRPAPKPDKPAEPVRPRPGSPLARPIDQQVQDNLRTLGVQPPPPPAQLPECLDPDYQAKGPDGKVIERPHAEPADPDRGPGWDPDHGYGPDPSEVDKATLGDLYRAAKWWVGDPLHDPMDAVGLVGWGKAIKYGNKGFRAIRGGDKAEDRATTVTKAPAKPPAATPPTPTVPGTTRYRHWTKQQDFEGQRVYQRDDLIDPGVTDKRRRTNLQRMQKGLAPLGPDGKAINLHHTTQRNDGALAEVSQTMHQKSSKVIHINPSSIPSGIDRKAFNRYRKRYWQERAKDFDPLRNLEPPSIAAP